MITEFENGGSSAIRGFNYQKASILLIILKIIKKMSLV